MFHALSHYYPEYLTALLKRGQMRNQLHRRQKEKIEDSRERIENAMLFNTKDRFAYELRRKSYLETTEGGSQDRS